MQEEVEIGVSTIVALKLMDSVMLMYGADISYVSKSTARSSRDYLDNK